MNGGSITLNGVSDAQLEALLDVKKNNEGQFQVQNVQSVGQPGVPPPHPPYGPGSPWGMGPGYGGQWFGQGSPYGPQPPGFAPNQPFPAASPQQPGQPQSLYNVTLTWQSDQALQSISAVFDRMSKS